MTHARGAAHASESPADEAETSPHRLRTISALAVAAAIFASVGYWVVEPVDPEGPICLLLTTNRFVAMVEMLGLAVVAAGLGTAISGATPPGIGPLCVATGLAAVSLRGGSADVLPLSLPAGVPEWPVRSMTFELWLWLGLASTGAVIEHWVRSWSAPPHEGHRAGPNPHPDAPVDSASEIHRALGAIAVTALLAYVLVSVLGGDPHERVLKGQVYFSVATAFFLSAMLAQWFFRVRSALWLVFAVAAVGMLAYLFASPTGSPELMRRGAHLALPAVARPMPIEYAALGLIGAVLGHAAVRNTPEGEPPSA